MRKMLYWLACSVLFCSGATKLDAQSLAGTYSVTGYAFSPGYPDVLYQSKTLVRINDSVYQAWVADLYYSDNYQFQFTVNSANQLVNWVPVGNTPAGGGSGFMTTDNPGGNANYPASTTGATSAVYNNTYDSVTHTFYMHYGYSRTGGTGEAGYEQQVYEKWEIRYPPVVTSFSPTHGVNGSIIMISGSHFLGAGEVRFGNDTASFTVLSDTLIRARVGTGSSGDVGVGSEAGYNSLPGFVYDDKLVIDDSSWLPLGKRGFSNPDANYVSMAFDTANVPYAVYTDRSNGNKATVVKLGANHIWTLVGTPVSASGSLYPALTFDNDNLPIVAYIDLDDSIDNGDEIKKVSVQKFNGTSWDYIGDRQFTTTSLSPDKSNNISLEVTENNIPVLLVTTKEGTNRWHLNLLEYTHLGFDDDNWISKTDGTEFFYSHYGDASMAIDKKTNNIYIATTPAGDGGMVVDVFDGYFWNSLGYVSSPHPYMSLYPDIAIGKDGIPVVSAIENYRADVFKQNGADWDPVGTLRFSDGGITNLSLALDSAGQPYVAFNEAGYSRQGTVMHYNPNVSTGWERLGASGFATSVYLAPNAIAVSKNNVPYVAFADNEAGNAVSVLQYGKYDTLAPRTTPGLYSQGDSAFCQPWQKQYPDWTNYNSSSSTIEMQTQFQDTPGNLCGYQSYVDTAAATVRIEGDSVVVVPRNYRISFSGSPFASPVGIRLFTTAAEVEQTLARANANSDGGVYDTGNLLVYRYDGPNEDYRIDNNQNYHASGDSTFLSNYTRIVPTVHYYGANNEYCYFEFYTNRFSEFYIGVPVNGVLPVHLLNFSAALQNHTTLVSWQTSSEVNASYYTVQRSTDGVHFVNTGRVAATNTNGNHSYQYSDDLSSLSGITKVYYRLQATDKDGSSTTSNIVSVSLSDSKLITIRPNPAHSYAVVTCNVSGRKTITVTDMNGRKVFVKTTANTTETIGVGGFAKGIYLVRTDYANGYNVQKLVVE